MRWLLHQSDLSFRDRVCVGCFRVFFLLLLGISLSFDPHLIGDDQFSSFPVMGRGRVKKSKVSSGIDHEDPGSHKEEKVPAPKRRGRPQKVKGEIVVAEFGNKFEEGGLHDDAANGALSKEMKSREEAENGKMGRKQNSLLKEETNGDGNDHDAGAKSSCEDLTKMNGFRHSGSRRKSRPHRAAEVGVECQWNWF